MKKFQREKYGLARSSKLEARRLFLVLIFLSAFSFQLSANNVDAQGLFDFDPVPVPPQSERLETRKEQSEINQMDYEAEITHYQSALSPEVILGFYQQNLPQNGWQALGQSVKERGGMAAYSKGTANVNISVYTLREGISDIYITRAKIPKELPWAKIKQGEDMPGQDLPWAPRFPGAVRTLYMRDKKTGNIIIAYTVYAQPAEIIEFYQRKMPNNGWRFINDVELTQLPGLGEGAFATLFYEGFRGKCQVSVNKRAKFYHGIEATTVGISYIP